MGVLVTPGDCPAETTGQSSYLTAKGNLSNPDISGTPRGDSGGVKQSLLSVKSAPESVKQSLLSVRSATESDYKSSSCAKLQTKVNSNGFDPCAAVVVFGAGLALFIVHGITWSSGVLYVVFLDAFKQSRAETAWIGSLLAACGFAASPISSILVNRYGCRFVVMLSGVIITVGMCISTFANNVYVLFFSYGVLAGVGCGFVYVPANVIVAQYFTNRRTIALGVSTCCGGLGSFAFPPLLQILLEEYNWRGTFLIIGGLSLNVCVAGALMRPAKVTESKLNVRAKRDLSIFKNINYHILCWNNVLFCFATSIVYIHLGSFAKMSAGIDDKQGALLFSMIGVFTFIGRFGFGLLAQIKSLRPVLIYTIFFLVGGIGTLVVPTMSSFSLLIVYSALFGLAFAALGGALLPSILIDIAGLESLSFSYGVLILYESVGQVLGAPVAGWIFEKFSSYNPSFYMGGAMIVISGLMMVVPICNAYRAPPMVNMEEEFEEDSSDSSYNWRRKIEEPWRDEVIESRITTV